MQPFSSRVRIGLDSLDDNVPQVDSVHGTAQAEVEYDNDVRGAVPVIGLDSLDDNVPQVDSEHATALAKSEYDNGVRGAVPMIGLDSCVDICLRSTASTPPHKPKLSTTMACEVLYQ